MIGVDTNIIARAILEDDPKQIHIAQQFLEKNSKLGNLYLSPYMLLELSGLLKSKDFSRQQIATILEKLLHSDGVVVGQKSILIAALHLYSKKNISFTDCLISCDCHLTSNAKTVTFDRLLQKADPQHCVGPDISS